MKYANVAHQLDVWHKSNKLDKKLMEVGKLLMHFYIDFVFKLSFLQVNKKSGNLVLRDWLQPYVTTFGIVQKNAMMILVL